MLTPTHNHRPPATVGDRLAYGMAWCVDRGADLVFGQRHAHRAVVLETIAAVPGMVGALIRHLQALRRIERDEGGVEELIREAQNERFHLLVFSTIARPNLAEKLLIRLGQALFLIGYTVLYLVSRRVAHRYVAYLEERAVDSYTLYLYELQHNRSPDQPAPAAAIEYWQLPAGATLLDVVAAVRRDEEHHRDHNHSLAEWDPGASGTSGTRSAPGLSSPSPPPYGPRASTRS